MGVFDDPVQATSPVGDDRLFVVERPGRIRVLGADGVLAAEPFLDISTEVESGGAEQGLLGLAFAPDFATSGHFFVYLTAVRGGEVQIRRYTAGDPASGTVLLRQPHGQFANHNGGALRVGPDGKLWAGIGDGGGANNTVRVDGEYSAQSLQTLLGKVVRIELDGTVPADNPVPSSPIWQRGLRNPYRFSFDRATGALYIGDVGQDAREEVDVAAGPERGPGANWGWPCREGRRANVLCTAPGAVDPAFELTHDGDGAASIIGGVVVRDTSVPDLAGRYLYTDIAFGELRSLAVDGATLGDDRVERGLAASGVVSIDEDGCGRVVVTSLGGPVYRLVDGAPRPCADPADPHPPVPYPVPDGISPPGGGGDPATRCAASVRVPERVRRRTLRRRGVRVRVAARSGCVVRARIGSGRVRRARLVPGASRVLRVLPAGKRVRRGRVVVRVLLTRPGADAGRERRFVVRVRRR